MEEKLNIIKALSDGNRARVVMALLNQQELCVCEITELLDIKMATVSRHMSILQNARLVQSRKTGRWVYYRLADLFPALLKRWLKENLAETTQISRDMKSLTKILRCDPAKGCINVKK